MGKNTSLLISLLLLIGLVLSSPVVSGSATTSTDQEEVNMTAVEAAMKLPNADPWKYCIAKCDDQCAKRCKEFGSSWVVYKCEALCCCQTAP